MIATKEHRSRTESSASSKKLFEDYPYPILTELSKTSKQRKSSAHRHALRSLQWYRECFHRMFGMLHTHDTPTSILEQSFRQVHIDEISSETIVNNLQKTSKRTRIKYLFVTPTTTFMNDQEQTNESRIRRINMAQLNHHIADDRG
jgi:hypothetical protein